MDLLQSRFDVREAPAIEAELFGVMSLLCYVTQLIRRDFS
jgi:hypothetical protein